MVSHKTDRSRTIWNRIRAELRWLAPGLGVKRWLGIVLVGITLIALGFAVILIDVYRSVPDNWLGRLLAALALQSVDRTLRGLVFGGAGLGLILWGMWGLNHALLKPFLTPGKPVLETVSNYRRRERGPRVVVIGGGTGLAALLRGLKTHTRNLTAVVTVADDGGSSGALRRSMGILPPGDIRNCLAALSNDEALMTQIFQYRFGSGAGLGGHTLGNLFISALAEVTGSFEEAVAESGRVLAVQGRVLPATLHDVRLVADVQIPEAVNEVRVTGESQIPKTAGRVRRIWLEPNNPLAFPPAVQAILSADMVIVGPGSLYTSILPNLLVPDLGDALRATRAVKFFIVNVATQAGETDGYTCRDHIQTIEKHIGRQLFDLVLCNRTPVMLRPADVEWVSYDEAMADDYPVYTADLVDRENPRRHDSEKLASVVMDLYYDRTGPLSIREEESFNSNNRA